MLGVLAWKLLVVAFALYGVAVVVSGLGMANLSRWLGLLAVVVAFVWVPVALFLALRALMRRRDGAPATRQDRPGRAQSPTPAPDASPSLWARLRRLVTGGTE